MCCDRAPKSREVFNALKKAKQCVRDHKGALPSVPLHLRNAPTKLMKDLGMYINIHCKDMIFISIQWIFPMLK